MKLKKKEEEEEDFLQERKVEFDEGAGGQALTQKKSSCHRFVQSAVCSARLVLLLPAPLRRQSCNTPRTLRVPRRI